MFESFTSLVRRKELITLKRSPRLTVKRFQQHCYRGLIATLITSSSVLSQSWFINPAFAQTTAYCRLSKEAIAEKENLRQLSVKGDLDAQKRYRAILKQHADYLQQCRSRTWPNNQATWLRLYPCDIRPGVLDDILDRIVSQGYNQVYVETFGNSQVLLPAADNPTPWQSVVRSPGNEKVDLLAQTIQKGRERGLKVYAWMFTMNFGYAYAQRPERQSALARNHKGETTLAYTPDEPQAFVDPYSQLAKADYYRLVQAVVRRKPDGILFDYVRYMRGTGPSSVTSKVQDLWIYGDSAKQALYNRALNNKGRDLIQRYISKGFISAGDVQEVDTLYPQEPSPLWQGRTPPTVQTLQALAGNSTTAPLTEMSIPAAQRQPRLQWELWQLSLAHAVQGVLDFVAVATLPAQQQGIKTGAVFFPGGNQPIGQMGFDSRLQAWDRFPSSMEWHPMVYGVCGNTSCIEQEVQRVLKFAPPGTQVAPVLAGLWGQSWNNRPSVEAQMQGIRQIAPQINTISHFAFSWQNPDFDRARQTCRAGV